MKFSSNYTVDQAIGQKLIFGFNGTKPEQVSDFVEDINQYHLGGIILFDKNLQKSNNSKNIENPDQTKALIEFIVNSSSAEFPLFIAIDEEGGNVSRLKEENGFIQTFSNQELGNKHSKNFTINQKRKIANQLKKLGINYNLSPVVDVNINPDNPIIGRIGRSFSNNPSVVIQQAKWCIKAFRKYGIITCLKHFPGHGSSMTDTHLAFTNITNSYQESELNVFQTLIKENYADSIMVGHPYNRYFDNVYPASLSTQTINGILRKTLSFDGVVISDCLQMGALRSKYSLKQRIILAINAGVDILLFSNNQFYDKYLPQKVIHIIKEAIKTKEISEQHIYQSFYRINQLKQKLKCRGGE